MKNYSNHNIKQDIKKQDQQQKIDSKIKKKNNALSKINLVIQILKFVKILKKLNSKFYFLKL